MAEHSYSNLQIKSKDYASVRQAMEICDLGSAKILARVDVEWIGVYPFLAEDDFAYLKLLAERMSARLDAAVFGFIVPRPDEFKYALYENGIQIDEFHTQANDDPESNSPAASGNAEILQRYCVASPDTESLKQLLGGQTIQADERLGDRMASQFAELLGIPRAQVCTGYNYLKWAQAGR